MTAKKAAAAPAATSGPLIDGVTIRMGGRDWIVPPLTLGQMKRLLPRLRSLRDGLVDADADDIDTVVDLVAAALQRNYPEMTPARVEDLVDMGNSRNVMNAILTGSGLRSAGEGAAEATSQPTSAPSMPASPPPSTGLPPSSTP